MRLEPEGRLELTWSNKTLRLLSHGEDTYEWCDPTDFRVSEVRLLEEVMTVGDPGDNLVIQGDAMHALESLIRLPEFAGRYLGKVKCCYIDPPFRTGQTFKDYDDALEHSVWLTLLRDRLTQIHKLLSNDGSVWVHLDDGESHRARAVLDEVFGSENFIGTFTWEKLYARKSNAQVSANHDFIHAYRKSPAFQMHQLPLSDEVRSRYKNPDDDPRGPWQSVSFHVRTDNPERRAEYRYEVELPSGRMVGPPPGRHWNGKRDRYDRLLADNLLWFGKDGDSLPRFKQFVDFDAIGLVPFTIWPRSEVGDNDEAKSHIQAMFPKRNDVFATPKPERLLERIIRLATNEGDLVLDSFAGSGTTAAVSLKTKRRFVTVEMSAETVVDYILPRLKQVVAGTEPGGVTSTTVNVLEGDLPDGVDDTVVRKAADTLAALFDDDVFQHVPSLDEATVKKMASAMRKAAKVRKEVKVAWNGGSGFRVLEVGPSMFEDTEGFVVLSEWATAGNLAQGVAAQLGYTFEPDMPFAGRKGRSRLAVIDGVLGEDIVRYLIDRLDEGERLMAVAQAVEPGCDELARELRPGSRVRKVPRDLVRSGRRRPTVTVEADVRDDADDAANEATSSTEEQVS